MAPKPISGMEKFLLLAVINHLTFTNNSGRIVYRSKTVNGSTVWHAGIEIGTDNSGNRWFMHHHIDDNVPTLVNEETFGQGEYIFYDNRPVKYTREDIVNRAVQACLDRKQFSWLWQNCQHFVNEVTRDVHYSEDIDRLTDYGLAGGLGLSLLGVFFKSKVLTRVGIGTMVVSGGAKVMSRTVSNSRALPSANPDPRLVF